MGDPEPQIRHPSPWGWLWAFCPSPASLTPEAGQPALTVPSSVPSSCTVGRDARGLPGEGEMSNTVVSSGRLPVRQKNCARVALRGRTTFSSSTGKATGTYQRVVGDTSSLHLCRAKQARGSTAESSSLGRTGLSICSLEPL